MMQGVLLVMSEEAEAEAEDMPQEGMDKMGTDKQEARNVLYSEETEDMEVGQKFTRPHLMLITLETRGRQERHLWVMQVQEEQGGAERMVHSLRVQPHYIQPQVVAEVAEADMEPMEEKEVQHLLKATSQFVSEVQEEEAVELMVEMEEMRGHTHIPIVKVNLLELTEHMVRGMVQVQGG